MQQMQRQYMPSHAQPQPTPQELVVPSQRKQLPTESHAEQLRHSQGRSIDLRPEQRQMDSRYTDARQPEPRFSDHRIADRSLDHRVVDRPIHDSRHVERRAAEAETQLEHGPAPRGQEEHRQSEFRLGENKRVEQRQPEHRHIEPRPLEPRPSRPPEVAIHLNSLASRESRPPKPLPLEVLRSQPLQTAAAHAADNATTDARASPMQTENRSTQSLHSEARRGESESNAKCVSEASSNEPQSVQQRVAEPQSSRNLYAECNTGKMDELARVATQKYSAELSQGDAEQQSGPTEPIPSRSEAKRKAAEHSSSSNPKRPRTVDIAANEGQDAIHFPAKRSPRTQRSAQPVVERTISFDEVYQNGQAQFKHKIFEYKQGSGNWYIARCDEHGVHFGFGNPVHGAAKHVHSPQHGNLEKKHELAIEICGHRIPDCTAELAELNNRAFEHALSTGYKVFNKNLLTKEGRRRLTGSLEIQTSSETPTKKPAKQLAEPSPTPPPPPPPPQIKASDSALIPEACKFYQGLWQPTKKLYMLIVLPILPGGSLKSVGLKEKLQETDLIHNVPKCYRVDRLSFQIKGWQPAYEDGGPKVAKREYPVMYFDNYQKHSLGWLTAAKLSPVDLDNPPEGVDKRGLFVAREWYAQHMMHRKSWDDFKKLGPGEPPFATGTNEDGERNGPSSRVLHKRRTSKLTCFSDSWPSLRSAHTDDQSPIRDKSSGPGMFGSSSEGGSDDEDPMTMDIGPIPEPADSNYAADSDRENSDVEMRDAPGTDDGDHRRAIQPGRRASNARSRGARSHSQKKSVEEKVHRRNSSTSTKKKDSQSLQRPKELDSMSEEFKSGLPTPATTDGGDNRDLNVVLNEQEDLRKSAQAKAAAAVMEAASRSRASSEVPETQTQAAPTSRPSFTDHQRSRSEDNSSSHTSKLNKDWNQRDLSNMQNADHVVGDKASASTENHSDPYKRVEAIRAEMDGLKSRSASAPGTESTHIESPFAPPVEVGLTQEAALQQSPPTSHSLLSPPSQASTLVPRSSSSTPVPGTGSGRDTPTAKILTSGNADKWQALRGSTDAPHQDAENQLQTPRASFVDTPAARTMSEGPKERTEEIAEVTAGIRQQSTPQLGTPIPEKEEFFDVAHFRDSARRIRWTRDDSETPYVRLFTDSMRRWAETNGNAPFTAAVEPLKISRVEVDVPEGQQQRVQVLLKNGGEQTLVFETNTAIGRSQNAALQARKFANWVKKMNGDVELRNG